MATAPLTPAEVGELWDFIHGDIMVGGIRQSLRASFGLCPRHTWGYAVVEVELWIYGTGPRGGHQPFDVCVLYTDLLAHTVGLLRRGRAGRSLARTLRRRGSCWICDQLGPGTERKPPRRSFAGADAATLAIEVGPLRHTTEWMNETSRVWVPRVCPDCSSRMPRKGQPDERLPNTGVRCLAHLATAVSTEVDIAGLTDYLQDVAARLGALGDSMRQCAAAPTVEQNSSWIEALGWFAGWDLPLQIMEQPGQVPD